MRKLLPLLLFAFALPAHAESKVLGRLTSTGASVNQSTTAVPFTVPATLSGVTSLPTAVFFAVQCDADAYVIAGTNGSSLTVSSTTGIRVAANAVPYPLGPPNSAVNAIAAISVSGTANCTVFEVYNPVALNAPGSAVARWLTVARLA